MRFFLSLVSLVLLASTTFAVDVIPDLAQSSPHLQWHSIENESVRVIYPDYLQAESVYIANLVEHYSRVVGNTYGIETPKKFDLVIRSEVAEPNGYVALAPRRSEWFTSSMFFPYVGSTEWYQTLSIHEYRHVNQFDFFNQHGTRVLYFLMGEFGEQLAMAMSLPSWYFEGDAVWTETKYTDGGRGRSPRFMARLKALVLSDKIPTYDQFLNGSYRTDLPNQYVYGYALISYGTQKYGEDIWENVIREVSRLPIPLRLYVAFKNVTGQSFQDFYNEAMNDLRTKWKDDMPGAEATVDFREHSAPYKVGDSLYFIRQTLDTHPQLIRQVGGEEHVVAEFPYNREIMGFDLTAEHAVYTQFLPDERYGHKGSSDLVVLNLKSGKKQQVTDGERIYNPSFNKSGSKIITTRFKVDQTWHITEFDLNGKILQSFALPDSKVAEVRYLDDSNAVVILGGRTGLKSLVVVDLETQKVMKEILPPSRNMLHSLFVDAKGQLLFEGQYQGHTEVFKYDGQSFTRCTSTKLGAYTPSSDGENFYYSNQDTYGSVVATAPLSSCGAFEAGRLVDFKYLGTSPSDNYNGFTSQAFPDQADLYTKNADQYHAQPYPDFDKKLFIPHTWGLNVGRGGGLGLQTDNYLRTLSLSATLGSSAEEGKAFADLNFDIKKYYPIFRLQLESRGRSVEDFNTDDKVEWTENTAGLGVLLPYIKKWGLYNFTGALSGSAAYTDTSSYEFNDVVNEDETSFFYKTSSALSLTWNKSPKARSIIAPWLLNYTIRYDDADQPDNSMMSSYRVLQKAVLNTPAFADNDGFMVTYDEQKQEASLASYRFLPDETVVGYVFSRGYDYENVPFYQKVSGNYVVPLAYPDWNLGGWYYLRRIYSTAFFDSTFVKDEDVNATLNSYGAEMYFESKILRFLPMTFGVRVLQRLEDDKTMGQFFLASALGF